MNENTTYVLLWMLIVAGFGFMAGLALGEETARRRCAEQKVEDLRDRLQQAAAPSQERQLKKMRSVLNDVHRMIHGVTKGVGKQAS